MLDDVTLYWVTNHRHVFVSFLLGRGLGAAVVHLTPSRSMTSRSP